MLEKFAHTLDVGYWPEGEHFVARLLLRNLPSPPSTNCLIAPAYVNIYTLYIYMS